MPKGISKITGLGNFQDRHHTEETILKMSESQRKRIAEQGFFHLPGTRAKMSQVHKGQISGMKGKHHTREAIEKMKPTQFKKGDIPFGKGLTKETSEIIRNRSLQHSLAMKGRPSPKKGMSFPEYGGSNHWNWQGGITPEVNARVNSLPWKQLRKEVYKRDDYACQICGKRGGKLVAHHRIPYRISQNDGIENLVTVCPHCHYLEDLKFNRELSGIENS